MGLDLGGIAAAYNGVRKGIDDEDERVAREENRAFQKQQQAQQREEWAARKEAAATEKAKRAALKAASSAGDVTEEGDGVGPLEEGQEPPKRFKVGGVGYGTRDEAEKVGYGLVNKATAQALRASGDYKGALELGNATKQSELTDMQLKKARREEADSDWNRNFDDLVAENGNNVFTAVGKLLTKSQIPGLAGEKVEAVVSPDKKTVTMRRIKADGTAEDLPDATYSNDEAGQKKVRDRFMKMDPSTRSAILDEKIKTDKADARYAQEFNLKKEEVEIHRAQAAAQLKHAAATLANAGGHLMIARADEARKKALFEQEAKIPAAVKTKFAQYAESAKLIDSAIAKATAEGNWKPEDPSVQKMIADRASLSVRMGQLLDPYIPAAPAAGAAPAANPLGLVPAGAAPAPVPAPKKPQATPAEIYKRPAGGLVPQGQ